MMKLHTCKSTPLHKRRKNKNIVAIGKTWNYEIFGSKISCPLILSRDK